MNINIVLDRIAQNLGKMMNNGKTLKVWKLNFRVYLTVGKLCKKIWSASPNPTIVFKKSF